MQRMSTKEKVLVAALDLFSKKGYDGVGMDQLGAAVGIKGPSLYKHFKGKEDILNTLLERMEEHYSKGFSASAAGAEPASMQELVAMSMSQITFTMNDPQVCKVRRFLQIEQFRSDRLAQLNNYHQLFSLQQMYTGIFQKMMEKGILIEDDPSLLALEYISTPSMLIHIADRQPARKQEMLEQIHTFLVRFAKTHGKEIH